MRPVGIFGGSFDPPHVGHAALVETAFRELGLPEIWVIPVCLPVHRRLSGRAGAGVRLGWLKRVFAGQSGISVQDWELRSTSPVPTIDTLRRVRERFPERLPLLLLGADAFAEISTWVDYPAHLDLCDVAVFDRIGCPAVGDQGWHRISLRQWREDAEQGGSGRLLYIHSDLPDVSATRVRRRAAAGGSLAGLVPECVREEIERAYGQGAGPEHKERWWKKRSNV